MLFHAACGNWRKELLFILQQERNLYQIYQQQIVECDTALAAYLQTLDDKVEPGSQPPPTKANKRAGSNAPTSFDLRGEHSTSRTEERYPLPLVQFRAHNRHYRKAGDIENA